MPTVVRRCPWRARADAGRRAGRRRPGSPDPALHRVVGDRGRARCGPSARGDRGSSTKGNAPRTAGRRSASGRRGRRAMTARESSRSCPSRATRVQARRRAPPQPTEEPPLMRCGVVGIAGCAVVGVFAGEVVGVFAHVPCADRTAPARVEALDQHCVAWRRGAVAVDLGAGRVERPATSKRFLTANGTPARGPAGAPRRAPRRRPRLRRGRGRR